MIEREDAVNWSTLKEFRKSARHYRHRLEVPRKDTDSLLLGRVFHCLVYEPDEYENRYVRELKFHRGMKDGTAIGKGYDGGRESAEFFDASVAASGLEVVPADLFDRASAMAKAVREDPIAGPMVTGGYIEQTFNWTDQATGIECRGRIDHVNGRLTDLKSAENASPRIFAAAAARYGYHGQMGFYDDGLRANGIACDLPPAFIVVESSAPFDVIVYELTPDALASGKMLYRLCLNDLSECRETGIWPGMADGRIQQFDLPEWARTTMQSQPLTLGGEALII